MAKRAQPDRTRSVNCLPRSAGVAVCHALFPMGMKFMRIRQNTLLTLLTRRDVHCGLSSWPLWTGKLDSLGARFHRTNRTDYLDSFLLLVRRVPCNNESPKVTFYFKMSPSELVLGTISGQSSPGEALDLHTTVHFGFKYSVVVLARMMCA